MRKTCKIFVQVLFLFIISRIMNSFAAWLYLPIPGSILGLITVFLLLQFKVLPRKYVEEGSEWLIDTMLLFFIPPTVGIISYRQLIMDDGFRIALVIGVGTIIVMVWSGLLAQWIARRKGGSRL